jgi:DNA polymerase delta subunit 1
MTTFSIFPCDFSVKDLENVCTVCIFGKNETSQSTCVRIPFPPYFFVGPLPESWSPTLRAGFVAECVETVDALPRLSTCVQRKSIWGYSPTPRWFCQLAFVSTVASKKARRILGQKYRHMYKTFESTVDPLLRFFHITSVKPASWVRVAGAVEVIIEEDKISRCDVEYVASSFRNVSHDAQKEEQAPLVLCSWDIECVSADERGFPMAHRENDAIVCIGCTFQKFGDLHPYLRVAICLGEVLPDKDDTAAGIEYVCVSQEADVMLEFFNVLAREGADVLIGYNVFGFDFKYMFGRSLVLVDADSGNSLVDLSLMGRSVEGGGEATEKRLASAAFGDNSFFTLTTPGILQVDLLVVLRKDFKLASYSLSAVSRHFLDDDKLDLPARDLFRKYFHGTSRDKADIARYCIRDTELPLRLLSKLNTLPFLFEMANAVTVPCESVMQRGMQIRVFSCLIRKARLMKYIVPDPDYTSNSASTTSKKQKEYEGATVLDAKKEGFLRPYFYLFIVYLFFTHSFIYSLLLLQGAYLEQIVSCLDFASLYPSIIRAYNMCYSTLVLAPPPPAYREQQRPTKVHTVDVGNGTICCFSQDEPGVVPSLLEELAAFRKAAKKDMALANSRGDAFAAKLLDGKQNAYKVVMNSMYGFLGAANGGYLPCVDIAASVTSSGRLMISQTKQMVESLAPGSQVVYGDSVASYVPVVVRQGGLVRAMEAHDLFARFCIDKQGWSTWTDQGWTPVRDVVRHRLEPSKRLVRVCTGFGIVVVTEDHSLLMAGKGNEWAARISPLSVTPNTPLVHHDAPLLDVAGSTMVPDMILSAPSGVRWEFFKTVPKTCPTLLDAASVLSLAKSLGFEGSVVVTDSLSEGGGGEYTVVVTATASTNTTNKLPFGACITHPIDVVSRQPTEYVYDLTTANGHFAAGAGSMIVHNTDSIMVILGPSKDMHHHFDMAQKVADQISSTFPPPIELEFEKTYSPYLLFSKKRYAGRMFTRPHAPDKVDVKGLQLVRRDSCDAVKRACQAVLDCIMHDTSVDMAAAAARAHILAILKNEVPFEQFVVSKSLRMDYKNDNLPHVAVARKISQRSGGSIAPCSGERVPYVFVLDSTKPDALQHERAEDPAYAREHDLALDALYYLDHQLSKPLSTLLEIVGVNFTRDVLGHTDIAARVVALRQKFDADLHVAKRLRKNAAGNQKEITTFFFKM